MINSHFYWKLKTARKRKYVQAADCFHRAPAATPGAIRADIPEAVCVHLPGQIPHLCPSGILARRCWALQKQNRKG